MKYLKLFEDKLKNEEILLLPSGEIIEVGPNTVDIIFYDEETYDFDDYEIEWDMSINMYTSKDKYKGEILKRNELILDKTKNDSYFKRMNESLDWDDEDFEEDEMDYILGADMYFITVRSKKIGYGWSNCLHVEKGIIKFATKHITYPSYMKDRYKIPTKDRTIYRYMWIPTKGTKSEFSEEYMKKIVNNFDSDNFHKIDMCFSTKDKLYDNLKIAIDMASKRIRYIGDRYYDAMKNIDINELIENIDNNNFKYYITGELKKK